MADASWELQQALFSKLDGDATLDALITGVFDSVPPAQAFPYVTIGDGSAADFGTKTEQGQSHAILIHAWARDRGRRTVKQILARVYTLLHEQILADPTSPTVFENVLTRWEFGDTFLDPDGLTYHGVARYRIITQ